MLKQIVFTFHLEQIDSHHYRGCIAEIPQLSRVVGESLFDVGSQLLGQLAYLIDEMPASWLIEIHTDLVLHQPLSAA
jgi:hypothetical protein